jgi:hypothetical protein
VAVAGLVVSAMARFKSPGGEPVAFAIAFLNGPAPVV